MVSAARSPETKLRTPTERARIWRTRSDGKPADFREASHSAGIPQTLGAGMCFMAPALLSTSEAASLPEIGLACGGRRGKLLDVRSSRIYENWRRFHKSSPRCAYLRGLPGAIAAILGVCPPGGPNVGLERAASSNSALLRVGTLDA